jgi:hypothetical protein
MALAASSFDSARPQKDWHCRLQSYKQKSEPPSDSEIISLFFSKTSGKRVEKAKKEKVNRRP